MRKKKKKYLAKLLWDTVLRGNDHIGVENLLKISNQAMVGGLTVNCYRKFNNMDLGFMVSASKSGLYIDGSLINGFLDCPTDYDVNYTVILPIYQIDADKYVAYIKLRRNIKVSRDALCRNSAKGAIITDYYSLCDQEKEVEEVRSHTNEG